MGQSITPHTQQLGSSTAAAAAAAAAVESAKAVEASRACFQHLAEL